MVVSMIWGSPGSGKTVASTAPKDEKILLLCSDNSSLVLNMFDRPNVTVEKIEHWVKPKTGGTCFVEQFAAALDSKKYTVIVVDNLTDLKEMALLELEDAGEIKDRRQIYQAVYMALKRLTRLAANAKVHITFTAWDEVEEITLHDGTRALRFAPNLPPKVRPQIVGLCNIVGQMAKAKDSEGKDRWYMITHDSETRYGCKDQLGGRKTILPEDLYKPVEVKKA